MPRLVRPLVPAAAVALLAVFALPAAGDWIVVLANGSELVSRYQPEEASWDPSVVLVMTAEGNTIGLSRDDVASVTSDIESRGFGTVIDDKTIALGWSPNDQPVPEEAGDVSPELALLQQMVALQAAQTAAAGAQPASSVQQFVDPSLAGGGLPAFGVPSGGDFPGDFTGFPTGPVGPTGIVTAPPSTAMPIPQTGSLPFQGSSLPIQGSALPGQGVPAGGLPAGGGVPTGGVPGSGVSP